MNVTPEEAFATFHRHWEARSPRYRLDDPAIREKLMGLISFCMVAIKECPEAFDVFYATSEQMAQRIVPERVRKKVYETSIAKEN